MADAIGFGELVGLMVLGKGEVDVLRGEIHTVEGDVERRYRLWRRGNLSREEDQDGTVLEIVGVDGRWHRDVDTGEVWMRPHERHVDTLHAHSPIGGLDVGDPRPSWERWTGTDFTRPTRAVESTEFLGRRAYALELAPPAHKPHPMQLIVDAETGLVLRAANAAFGWSNEWAEVEIGGTLSDELFVWSGPAQQVRSRAEQLADFEAEDAQRRAWLDSRGISELVMPIAPELRLHESDDATGAFYASMDLHSSATLLRRPRSPEHWPEPETTNYPHSQRWSDDRWDWFLAGDWALDDDDFARLRDRLSTTT